MKVFFRGKVSTLLFVLLIVSPIFGVILADLVGYHEPMDVVAEELGFEETGFNWTPFYDYTVPGLPDTVGYIVAGLLGVLVIWGFSFLHLRLVSGKGR